MIAKNKTLPEFKVPAPDNSVPPSWAEQSMAAKEARQWPHEDELKGQRHKNDMLWLSCYGWIVVAFTVVFSLLFVASLGAWSWHYLASSKYAWLDADQLSKIQSVVFSGSLGAIVTSIIKKQIDK